MRFLAVSINGILDLKNFYPLALELTTKHSLAVDVVNYRKGLENLTSSYDGLIVGSDWNQNSDLVKAFNNEGKKTVLMQSEGMFVDASQWYIGKVPITDIACLWGREHRDIFLARGYGGETIVTGPPRFDVYHNFKPSLSREQVYATLGLEDGSKPFILYLGQFFPKHEFGEGLYNGQIDLTRFAGTTPAEFYGLIKAHPQEPGNQYWFSRAEVLGSNKPSNVRFVDRGGHTEAIDISTLMYFASAVVTFSSTAAIEAMFIGTPAAIFEGGLTSPLCDGRIASLPALTDINGLADIVSSGVNGAAYSDFMRRFLPGSITGRYTSVAAEAIAALSKRAKSKPIIQAALSDVGPESDRQSADLSAFQGLTIAAYSELASNIIQDNLGRLTSATLRSLQAPPASTDHKRAEYYQALHENNNGYRTNNWLLPELPVLVKCGARKIVEFGCGNGRFLRAAAEVTESVVGVDFAKPQAVLDLPRNVQFLQRDIVTSELPSGDLACSADLLVHLHPDELMPTVEKIHNIAPMQYHLIACYDDGHSHQIIMHPGAWLAVFRSLSSSYRIASVRPRRNDPGQMICVISNI